jgi:hypothetical protein
MMETSRNNTNGEISVKAKGFTAVISEDGVRIQVGDALVHEWKPSPKHEDKPSPRSGPNRRRGAR